MKIEHLTEKDYQTTLWSGGTTTQLLLLPKDNSQYEVGKFDCRISSATIKSEHSVFTKLPGYKRLLLSLDDPLVIGHQRQKEISLSPYQVHAFDGDEDTESFGTCTDFNVIFNDAYQSQIEVLPVRLPTPLTEKNYFVYAINDCVISLNEKSQVLKASESLYLTDVQNVYITLQTSASKVLLVTLKPLR